MIVREELLLQYLQTLTKSQGTLSPAERKQRIERVCDELERCFGIEPIATITMGSSSKASESNKTITVKGSHNGGTEKIGILKFAFKDSENEG